MSLDERLSWLLVGIVIGYILSRLQDIRRGELEIKEELDEVVRIVRKKREKDEAGFMRFPLVADVLLLTVVMLTVFAAFSSQKAANESESNNKQLISVVEDLDATQAQLRAVTSCNTKYQQLTIRALNERTQYSTRQATANLQLQRAQAEFLRIVLILPPVGDTVVRASLEKYFSRLANFADKVKKNRQKALVYEYPTNEELSQCITDSVVEAEKLKDEKEQEHE